MELNADQKADFEALKAAMENTIKTESGLTELEIAWLIVANKNSNDPNYYFQLKHNRPTALSVNKYLQGLKRRSKGRVSEEKRAAKIYPDYSNIKNKLGLSQSTSHEKVVEMLKKFSTKSDATWKALKLNKKKVLSDYGI